MSDPFHTLRRIQKALYFEITCGNRELLRAYGDLLTLAEKVLPKADLAATKKLAADHVADFRFNEIPDSALLAWLPKSILPKGMAALVEL